MSYLRQAENRFGGKLDEFDCVKLSTHNKEVKKLLKGLITNIPEEQPDQWNFIDLPGDIKKPKPSARKVPLTELQFRKRRG